MHTLNVKVQTAGEETAGRWGARAFFDLELPPVRGLTIRIEWGQARVLRLIDAQKAAWEMGDVLWEAEYLGQSEFKSGEDSPPGMFSDSPELVNAWWTGWSSEAEFNEMLECPGCQNDSGEPCAHHG